MKKKYIRIQTLSSGTVKSDSIFLLSENITGYSGISNETKLFFKSSNPFTFALIHLTPSALLDLISEKTGNEVRVNKENSQFIYSIVTL